MNTMLALIATVLLLQSSSSYAGLRQPYDDATVAGRSELVVIGRLIPDSIVFVPHTNLPAYGNSGEHHAILAISEVLKGHCDTNPIQITIHHGLTPVVGGYVNHEYFMMNLRGDREDYPPNIVEIMDTGNSIAGFPPLVKDAAEDNIWFLRRLTGLYGHEAGGDRYGIVDPEDVQPLTLKDYFAAHLSTNHSAVAIYIQAHPDISTSRIERIIKGYLKKN